MKLLNKSQVRVRELYLKKLCDYEYGNFKLSSFSTIDFFKLKLSRCFH
jgi:hypothetical protein